MKDEEIVFSPEMQEDLCKISMKLFKDEKTTNTANNLQSHSKSDQIEMSFLPNQHISCFNPISNITG